MTTRRTTTLTPVPGTGLDATLTVQQVADQLQLNEATVRARIRDGAYDGLWFKVGREYRFHRERFTAWLAQRCDEAAGS